MDVSFKEGVVDGNKLVEKLVCKADVFAYRFEFNGLYAKSYFVSVSVVKVVISEFKLGFGVALPEDGTTAELVRDKRV